MTKSWLGALMTCSSRRKAPNLVVLSQDDEGMQETTYLLSSPKNAQRLLESIAQARKGHTKRLTNSYPAQPSPKSGG